MTRTLADTFDDYMESLPKKVVVAQAHAAISKGMVIQLAISTGLTSAPSANDRLGFFGVALEDVALGAKGRFVVDGFVQVLSGNAITLGALVDCSADMKVDPTTTQTDGNAFARVLETASAADKLVWAKLL